MEKDELKKKIEEKISFELENITQWNSVEENTQAAQAVECLVNAYRTIEEIQKEREMAR